MTQLIKKIKILLVLVLVALGIFLSYRYPDKNLFTLSSLERDQMLKRDGYLRIGLIGQIYGRKVGNYYFNRYLVYSLKLVQKVSIPLDPIRYFNSTGQGKISYYFLPFALLGIVYIIQKHLSGLYIYLFIAIIFTSLIIPDKTIYLYYPLIIFSIFKGIAIFYEYIKEYIK
jgi:hypothetical protein